MMVPSFPSRRSLALFLMAALLSAFIPLAVFSHPVAAVAVSPYELIAAVNGLRAARGLSQLAVNASLMTSAQAHTNYQASIGDGTNIGPGGTHPIDRARAAGYGGGAYIAVAENITSRRENTPELINKAIYQDWSDDLHMNTMLNPSLQHIGAGVAVANGIVYLTIDTGWVAGPIGPTGPTRAVSGTLPSRGPMPTAIPMVALVTSTPRPDGSVVHVVGYGQVLVKIAAAYGVKLAEIVAWNGINPDAIYAGQRLLVRLPSTKTPPGFQAPTPSLTASFSPSPSPASLVTEPPQAVSSGQSTADLPALAAAFPTSLPGESSTVAQHALRQVTSTAAALPFGSIQQLSFTEIAILVTLICGILGIILVSLRRK